MNTCTRILTSALGTLLLISGTGVCDTAPLKVGIIAPLSGPLAEYGQALQNGIDLAKADSPAIATNCNFAFEDSKYDPKTAVSSLQRLASDKFTVIYNWGGPTSSAVAPLAERLNVAMFVLSMDPRVSKGSSRVIRFANSGAEYGEQLAEALKTAGLRRVGIVRAENDYLNDVLGGLKRRAKPELEVEEIASYLPSDSDFRSSITKVRAAKLDAIGVFLISGQVSVFYRQLNEQNLKIPTFGTDFFESTSEVQAAGVSIEGAIFANNAVDSDFKSVYKGRFGNDYQITSAANGYDFATLLCRDLPSKNPGLSANDVLVHLKSVSSKGKLGPYSYRNEEGDKYIAFPIVIRKIVAGKIVTVTQDKPLDESATRERK
jgi:branched-chain amino acid transport system substrate-binding protein